MNETETIQKAQCRRGKIALLILVNSAILTILTGNVFQALFAAHLAILAILIPFGTLLVFNEFSNSPIFTNDEIEKTLTISINTLLFIIYFYLFTGKISASGFTTILDHLIWLHGICIGFYLGYKSIPYFKSNQQ